MSPRPANLHDVARLAEVSYQTVSRVVNNSPNVADDTRQRVLKAIEELDYRPNQAARSLITGRSQVIQLISFNIFFYRPLQHLMNAIRNQGYHSGLSILEDANSAKGLQPLMDELTARMVDGFLFFNPPEEISCEEYRRMCRNIPFVQVSGGPGPMVPAVVIDQEYGIRQVMEHLFSLGHQNIIEIPGDQENYDARQRHATYLAMMAGRQLQPYSYWRKPTDDSSYTNAGGFQAVRNVLQAGEKFTALVCCNDECALGALRALHEAGLRVPGDVSVVGFDDNPDVSYYEPPLTTVRQDYALLSRQSMDYLLAMIRDPGIPHYKQVIYPRLVKRQSTLDIAQAS